MGERKRQLHKWSMGRGESEKILPQDSEEKKKKKNVKRQKPALVKAAKQGRKKSGSIGFQKKPRGRKQGGFCRGRKPMCCTDSSAKKKPNIKEGAREQQPARKSQKDLSPTTRMRREDFHRRYQRGRGGGGGVQVFGRGVGGR